MKTAPRRVIIHLVPRPANVGVDHTLAALSRLGARVRRQHRRKAAGDLLAMLRRERHGS